MDRRAVPGLRTTATDPLSVYGASKLAGEQAIRGGRWPLSGLQDKLGLRPEGKNFVLTMLGSGANAIL